MLLEVTPTPANHPLALQFLANQRKKMLIDGHWVEARSGNVLESIDPATGVVLAHIPAADASGVDLAVKAARQAFDVGPWPRMTPDARGRILWRIAELIEQSIDELAELETLDNGKPLAIARYGEIPMAAAQFRFFAGLCGKLAGATLKPSIDYQPAGKRIVAFTRKEPIGVVGAIIPWNGPLIMAALKLAPALCTGCTVVLKPAEDTSLTALRLGELMLEAGVPPGAINIVTGRGDVTGAALAEHPDVDKITFTGSTAVGRLIIGAARGNLKKVTLELGGKSPVIILADADIPAAIEGAASNLLWNCGQTCVAGSRLYAHRDVYESVVAGLAKRLEKVTLGHGLDPKAELGPLVSRKQADRVSGYVHQGLAAGAEIVVGGKSSGPIGTFFEPTVIVNATSNSPLMQEEIFGPVVGCEAFDDMSKLTQLANGTVYGLAASIWTSNVSHAHRLAEDIRAGTIWVNCHSYFEPTLPVGGMKQSGWGQDSGILAAEHYLENKTVCMLV